MALTCLPCLAARHRRCEGDNCACSVCGGKPGAAFSKITQPRSEPVDLEQEAPVRARKPAKRVASRPKVSARMSHPSDAASSRHLQLVPESKPCDEIITIEIPATSEPPARIEEPRERTAAELQHAVSSRTIDVPDDVRRLREEYKRATRAGTEPTDEQRAAALEYQRIRWSQLPEEERQRVTGASNRTRAERRRTGDDAGARRREKNRLLARKAAHRGLVEAHKSEWITIRERSLRAARHELADAHRDEFDYLYASEIADRNL